MTTIAAPDLLEAIAANAAALDARPEFPRTAFAALAALDPPAMRCEEWDLVRRVARADGSVGRLFEGHLNAVERLRLDGLDPGDHWLGVWGADPAPGEGEPAEIRGDRLYGTKVFCSGAGGLTRALVLARGNARLRRPRARSRGRQDLVPRRRDARFGVAPRATSTERASRPR